jgi:hypothetical protein
MCPIIVDEWSAPSSLQATGPRIDPTYVYVHPAPSADGIVGGENFIDEFKLLLAKVGVTGNTDDLMKILRNLIEASSLETLRHGDARYEEGRREAYRKCDALLKTLSGPDSDLCVHDISDLCDIRESLRAAAKEDGIALD